LIGAGLFFGAATMKIDALRAAYLEAYALHAVIIGTFADRAYVAHGATPEAALEDLRQDIGRPARIAATWWCADGSTAERLAAAIAEDGGDDVQVIADRIRVAVVSDDVLQARAAEAVAFVEQKLADMNSRGELKALNKRFKEERMAREAQGLPGLNYNAWLMAEKARMVRTVAEGVRARTGG
jgi:hypothetical protein